MGYQGIAKVQHYVPQFLLRNFGTGKKDQLFVFDKTNGRTFATNARNIAAESGFYDFALEGATYTLEPGLSQIEGKAKRIFQRISDADSVTSISAEDRALLCSFFAIQFTRTRLFKEQWRSLPVLLGERLRRDAKDESELEAVKDYIGVLDDNRTNMEVTAFMMKAPQAAW